MDLAFSAAFGAMSVVLFAVVLHAIHVVDRRARRRADEVLGAIIGLREALAAANGGKGGARREGGPSVPRAAEVEVEDEDEQTRVMRPSEVAWAQQVFDERPTIPVVMGSEEEEEAAPRRAALYPVMRASGEERRSAPEDAEPKRSSGTKRR